MPAKEELKKTPSKQANKIQINEKADIRKTETPLRHPQTRGDCSLLVYSHSSQYVCLLY